ncbi:MAG: hypothetical protein GY928_20490 [Colwellia sp.]|nr:hypothetical protein [Colwellia sp.]
MNVSEEQCFESIKLEQYFETMLAKHCDVLGFTIVLGKNNVLNFLQSSMSDLPRCLEMLNNLAITQKYNKDDVKLRRIYHCTKN